MIRKLIYSSLVVLVLVSSSSCNKWLDVKPQDGLIKQDYWKTKEQLNSAVIGTYILLTDNAVVSQLFRWGELRADMVAIAPTPGKPTVDDTEFMQGNILSTNSLVDWSVVYKAIANCNIVMENGPLVMKADPTFKLDELNKSLAEVRGIRALLYFYLLRTYGEVPLQLEGIDEDTEVTSLPKSSQQQIADQILADLAFAAEHAVETFKDNPSFDKGRITKYMVYALQADVYLWLDRYADAAAACDKIIASNKFFLVEGDPVSFFEELYVQGNSSETIFAFQYSDRANPFFNMFLNASKPYMASASAIENVFPADPVDPLLLDVRSAGVSYNPITLGIWKYGGVTSTTSRSDADHRGNYPIYRYADVLLMKAEALAWIPGNEQKVLDIIEQIRSNRRALDASKRTDITVESSSSALGEYVFEERGRELAFEGKRWFDLLRFAKRNNYENEATLISLATENIPSNLKQSVSIKLKDRNSHYLPVPFREIQANKNLIQNPFYQ